MRASFVIRAHNAESTIRRTVESALEQDFPKESYEIVVVDDGSTDSTCAVVSTFRSPLIRLIRQENAGVAGAGKTGAQEARGEILIFLDADDEATPEAISSFASGFQHDVAYVYGDYFEEYKGDTKLVRPKSPLAAPAGAFAWRRESFFVEGGYSYDTIFPEYDILFRTWGRWRGMHVSRPVFVYHRSKDSITGDEDLVERALQALRGRYPERAQEIGQIRSYMLS
ncbi:hypothetical protein COU20_02315 [Candidatus Kaiserbacteria bacterium CG10_big_fil_rev_8_21_14_0_10_59_10]|uniref:Glycosyltransferase 2-like domain-containing protein n=1 Tax=Candidatus Kaiserbacteria bacterium CG10_big_fil_rev_8_21_14_0_10_59_10 TaxID=1974612 RepID=A0A2H0U7Q0_9BACT|nr:MAG: hypothetical protein COU20_02315 [Candidatus Kaiserbacteria bacterium CG10_big_fil_rev_8_21_14_0_10_59_10]